MWRLFEWLSSLYMLKMVMRAVNILMVTSTISWELTVIYCHEWVRIYLLIKMAAHDLLGSLWWVEGKRGYHLWLVQVLPRKSIYGSWRAVMSYMLGLMEFMRSCWAALDLLRFCCHSFTVVGVPLYALFIRWQGYRERYCITVLCESEVSWWELTCAGGFCSAGVPVCWVLGLISTMLGVFGGVVVALDWSVQVVFCHWGVLGWPCGCTGCQVETRDG